MPITISQKYNTDFSSISPVLHQVIKYFADILKFLLGHIIKCSDLLAPKVLGPVFAMTVPSSGGVALEVNAEPTNLLGTMRDQ